MRRSRANCVSVDSLPKEFKEFDANYGAEEKPEYYPLPKGRVIGLFGWCCLYATFFLAASMQPLLQAVALVTLTGGLKYA